MKKITDLFDGKTKKRKPNPKQVKAALKTHSKVRRTMMNMEDHLDPHRHRRKKMDY